MAKSNSGIIFALAAAGVLLLSGKSSKRSKSSSSGGRQPPLGPPPDDCVDTEVGVYRGIAFTEMLTGGAQPGDQLPMVIALHGLGHSKEYLEGKLEGLGTARVIIPDALYDRTEGRPGRRWWKGWHPEGLQAFMAEALPETSARIAPFVEGIQRCDPTYGRPVIAGHSQGGYVALDFAASFPELIKGSVPISAWRPTAIWDIEPLAPVVAIHGSSDDGVPYDRSREYYEEMIARGVPLTFRTTSTGHSLTTTNLNAWKQEIEGMLYS